MFLAHICFHKLLFFFFFLFMLLLTLSLLLLYSPTTNYSAKLNQISSIVGPRTTVTTIFYHLTTL